MTISVVSGLGLLTRDAIAVESVSTMMLKIGSRQVGRGRKEGRIFTRYPLSRRGTEARDPDSQARLVFLASCGEAWSALRRAS